MVDITGFPRHLFFSYDPLVTDLPAEVVLRQVLLYGDVDDMLRLRKQVSRERLVSFTEQLKASGRHPKRLNFIQKIILAK